MRGAQVNKNRTKPKVVILVRAQANSSHNNSTRGICGSGTLVEVLVEVLAVL